MYLPLFMKCISQIWSRHFLFLSYSFEAAVWEVTCIFMYDTKINRIVIAEFNFRKQVYCPVRSHDHFLRVGYYNLLTVDDYCSSHQFSQSDSIHMLKLIPQKRLFVFSLFKSITAVKLMCSITFSFLVGVSVMHYEWLLFISQL